MTFAVRLVDSSIDSALHWILTLIRHLAARRDHAAHYHYSRCDELGPRGRWRRLCTKNDRGVWLIGGLLENARRLAVAERSGPTAKSDS